jgi:hypothetical protein
MILIVIKKSGLAPSSSDVSTAALPAVPQMHETAIFIDSNGLRASS